MTPLAALLQALLEPGVALPELFFQWWVVWFALGRPFLATTLLALGADLAAWLLAFSLLTSGAVGAAGADAVLATGGWWSWLCAGAAVFAGLLAVEAAVLRRLMRFFRPGWRWDPIDLFFYGSVQALAVLAAGTGIGLGWWT